MYSSNSKSNLTKIDVDRQSLLSAVDRVLLLKNAAAFLLGFFTIGYWTQNGANGFVKDCLQTFLL